MKDIQILPEPFERELPNGYMVTGEYNEPGQIPVFKLKFNTEIAVKIYDEFQDNIFPALELALEVHAATHK